MTLKEVINMKATSNGHHSSKLQPLTDESTATVEECIRASEAAYTAYAVSNKPEQVYQNAHTKLQRDGTLRIVPQPLQWTYAAVGASLGAMMEPSNVIPIPILAYITETVPEVALMGKAALVAAGGVAGYVAHECLHPFRQWRQRQWKDRLSCAYSRDEREFEAELQQISPRRSWWKLSAAAAVTTLLVNSCNSAPASHESNTTYEVSNVRSLP